MALLAHYKLNGDGTDATGHGHDGTPVNVSWVAGKIGQAASFNGSSSYVNCGTLGNLGSNLGAGLTLAAWVKTTYTAGIAVIYGYQVNSSGTGYIILAHNYTPAGGTAAGALTIDLRDWSNKRLRFGVYSGAGIADGNWHHVAAACAPSAAGTPTGALYVDGVALDTIYYIREQQNNWQNVATFLALGADRYGPSSIGLYWPGLIDDARIYNAPLPPWIIKAIYNNGQGSEKDLFGTCRCEMSQAYCTGTVVGETYCSGSIIGQDFHSGVIVGQAR